MKSLIFLSLFVSVSAFSSHEKPVCFVAQNKAVAEESGFPQKYCVDQVDAYFKSEDADTGTTSLRGQKYFYEPQKSTRIRGEDGSQKVSVDFSDIENSGICDSLAWRSLHLVYSLNSLNQVTDFVEITGKLLFTNDACHSGLRTIAEIIYKREQQE